MRRKHRAIGIPGLQLTFAPSFPNSLISPLSSSSERHSIDFQDPAALRTLTQVLLKHDFGLHVPLREDRLCPPVPNRLNYVLWLQDLLAEQESVLDAIKRLDSQLLSAKQELGDEPDREPSSKRRKISNLTAAAVNQDVGPEQKTRRLLGLDIGTGASLIYPLLCCSYHPTATPSRLAPPPSPLEKAEWHMIGTDIDLESVKHARSLLSSVDLTDGKKRKMEERIAVMFRDEKQRGRLVPTHQELRDDEACRKVLQRAHRFSSSSAHYEDEEYDVFDCTMCNPPFYSSTEAMQASAKMKVLPANAACTGTYGEMIFDAGGEVGFVGQMIEESLVSRKLSGAHKTTMPKAKSRRTWYTSMLGLKSSVEILVNKLKANNVDNWLVTELTQGETRRWVLAWSLIDIRIHLPADSLASKRLSFLQLPATYREALFNFNASAFSPTDDASKQVESFIKSIPGATWHREEQADDSEDSAGNSSSSWLLGTREISWNRAERRKRARGELQPVTSQPSTEDWLIIVRLTLHRESAKSGDNPQAPSVRLDARWLYGSSESHFQSFCSYAARGLQQSSITSDDPKKEAN